MYAVTEKFRDGIELVDGSSGRIWPIAVLHHIRLTIVAFVVPPPNKNQSRNMGTKKIDYTVARRRFLLK